MSSSDPAGALQGTSMRKLKGLVRLFRPELPFSAGVCVILGEIVALGGFPSLPQALLGFLSVFFISASALILNDYFDLEVDRVNAPGRPLPSGAVTPSEVLLLTAVVTVLGLSAASLIGWGAFVFSLAIWLVGVLYNWRFKQSGLPGNLMVAVSVASTFILGGMAVGRPFDMKVWFFSLIAFLIDLAEEIAGDAMDAEGDTLRGSRSLAILLGKRAALRIAAALFILVVLLAALPFFLGWMGIGYLLAVLATGAWTLYSTAQLVSSRTPEAGRGFMRRIYLGATFAMLAFIAAQFLR